MLNKKTHKAVGQIYREYGVKGSCKFYSYSGGTENLKQDQKYLLKNSHHEELRVKIKNVSPGGRYFYVHFDVFDKPEEVMPWRKAVLWLDRKFYTFDEDIKFNFDWTGFTLLDLSGETIGVIEEMVQNPLKQFSVKKEDEKNVLIPFVKEWIVDVDRTHLQVKMNLPEGLIE